MATSLVKVHAYAGAWDEVQEAAVAAIRQGRMFGNASKTFANAIVQGATRAVIDGVSDGHLNHPTDSHPPLSERLEALKMTLDSVADDALSVAPQQPAATLIPELEKREDEVSSAYQALLARQLGIDLHATELEKRTSITRCPWCHTRVLPLANGTCPSCGKLVKTPGPEEAGAANLRMEPTPSEVREALDMLDAGRRARCLVLLCEPCLEHVRKYFADSRNRKYRDSVVGLGHEVDVDLPVRALSAIRAARGIPSASVLDALLADYQEPLTAHQDDDLTISDARAEYAYLAIYNFVRSCKNPDDKELAWLVVRQAFSATGPENPTQADVDETLARWVTAWPTP